MTRKECLEMAMGCVLQDRASQYGGVEDNFRTIANLWSVYLGRKVYPADVAAMMALLKIARAKANPKHGDNWVDLAGYAACGAECAQMSALQLSGGVFKLWGHKSKAEGDAKGGVQLIFKPGDPVEWFSFGRKDAEADGWHPAFYLCNAGDPNYHVVQDIDGMYHVVNYANIRSPEAMYRPGDKVEALSFDGSRWEDAVVERTEFSSTGWHCTVRLASGERHCLPVAGSIRRPSRAGDKAGGSHPENPDSSTAAQPKFKPGDKVEVCIPSRGWFEATYVHGVVPYHAVEDAEGRSLFVLDRSIRRPSKARAEGCEALVEKDAPRTPEEVCRRIVDSNPATYGHPHKPAGEKLAEMAREEDADGGA